MSLRPYFQYNQGPKGLFTITAQLLNKQKTSEENICSYIHFSDVYKIDSFLALMLFLDNETIHSQTLEIVCH